MDYVMLFLVGMGIFSVSLVTAYITMKNRCDVYRDELIKLKIKVDMLSQPEESPRQSRFDNITHEVLRLVREKSLTAREIQGVLGQSREHVARLVKKMADDGYLKRMNTRPYTYEITEKGLDLLKDATQKSG